MDAGQITMYGAIGVGVTLLLGIAFAAWALFFRGKTRIRSGQRRAPRHRDSRLPRARPNSFVIRPMYDKNGDWNPKGGIWRMYVQNPPGIPRRLGNVFYWLLVEGKGGHFVPYNVPDDVVQLPEVLFDALNCEPARDLLAYSKGFVEKANLIIGIVAIGVLLLAVIMAVDLI